MTLPMISRLKSTAVTVSSEFVQARHGRVNTWLCIVYLIMFVWALYYAITYWGGLGPGLDLGLQSITK